MPRNTNKLFKENWILLTIIVAIILFFSKTIIEYSIRFINFITEMIKKNMSGGKKNTTKSSTNTGIRGIRNNNPGNIKINSANKWTGKVGSNTDGVFEQFTDMKYGIRASLKLLHTYINSGRSTLQKIGDSWSDKDPNYVAFLVNSVGIGKDTAILIDDQATIKKIAQAIFDMETSRKFTDSEIDEAWKIL